MKDKCHATPEARLLEEAGLNQLPSDWDTTNVGDLLADSRAISVGVMYPGRHEPCGVPLLRVGDLSGSRLNMNPEFRVSQEVHREYQRTELQGGELLMTLVGGLGQCCVAPPQIAGWNAARAIAVMRLKEPSEADFVRYCLLMPPVQHLINAWANTTVQATLNLKEVRQLPLPWPGKDERKSITNVLKALDDKLELNRQMNRTLEETAAALFRSWFVDFDPVVAKAAGRPPAHLSPALASLFPDSFQDSELGPIPKGWRVRPLADVLNVKHGHAFAGKFFTDGPVGDILLTPGNFAIGGGFKDSKFKYYTGVVPEEYVLIENDLVLTMTDLSKESDTLGYPALIPPASSGHRFLHNQRLGKVIVREGESASILFLYQVFKSEGYRNEILASATGTTVMHTAPVRIIAYQTVFAPKEVLNAFDKIVHPWYEMIQHNNAESQTLAALRDTLLPKLLSGEVRVKEAEKLVGAKA